MAPKLAGDTINGRLDILKAKMGSVPVPSDAGTHEYAPSVFAEPKVKAKAKAKAKSQAAKAKAKVTHEPTSKQLSDGIPVYGWHEKAQLMLDFQLSEEEATAVLEELHGCPEPKPKSRACKTPGSEAEVQEPPKPVPKAPPKRMRQKSPEACSAQQ